MLDKSNLNQNVANIVHHKRGAEIFLIEHVVLSSYGVTVDPWANEP